VVELGEEKGHEEWVALALGRTFVMAGVRRSEVGALTSDGFHVDGASIVF
jgi:hypothetical protein